MLPLPEVILEFKIEGMTCVNCSQTIENAMKSEYGNTGGSDNPKEKMGGNANKGLISV